MFYGHSVEWWLGFVQHKLGADSVWGVVTFFVMVPTCWWLYFATCWNEIWASRIDQRMAKLRNDPKWPRSWWHHPVRGDLWPLFGHFFYTAMLFEVWFHMTVWHGKRKLSAGTLQKAAE
jgi:hypothetical protein